MLCIGVHQSETILIKFEDKPIRFLRLWNYVFIGKLFKRRVCEGNWNEKRKSLKWNKEEV